MLNSEQIDNWDTEPKQLRLWEDRAEYDEAMRVSKMTGGDMLKEFHTAFKAKRNITFGDDSGLEEMSTKLIMEEFQEFMTENDSKANLLKELADLVYVCYAYADRWGWSLDEALRRVHISNMSKLDDNGQPIFREDGKILKGPNYKAPNLEDLV